MGKWVKGKRILATGMSLVLCVPATLGTTGLSVFAAGENEEVEEVVVPEPYYEFTFDEGVEGENQNLVPNEGTKEGISAVIDGNGEGLGIVDDSERNSKVLNLPGDALNAGCLLLPSEMFSDVGQEGFAFSFWIKVNQSADHYNRIFTATSVNFNSEGWPYNAPEFTFVVGGRDTASTRYNSSIMLSDRSAQGKLIWDQAFTKEKWQHVTVSVDPENYNIYMDGKLIQKTDSKNNMNTILSTLFADDCKELKTNVNNAIGRSVYNTDYDLKAKIDEFRFYNAALTDEQAMAAYESYKVDESVTAQLQEKIEEAESKSISFYTKDTYEALQTKIQEAKEVVENPVTEANVSRMLAELEEAVTALEFYEGVDETTTYTSVQLEKEISEAEKYLEEPITEESLNNLKQALEQAKAAVEAKNQEEVDAALAKLRTSVADISYGATLHFDASGNTGDMLHGSTGFLYGVSENNVPSSDLLEAISPKILVQKAADGKQHPSGDGYRLTSYLEECGVENVQIYLQDYYLQWPYEYNGIDDYNEKVKSVVSKMVEGKTKEEIEKYSFVLFNEPDNIWYGGNTTKLCNDWLTIYNTVKGISPYIKVAGPNFASYKSSNYEQFFKFCSENNCLPEYITWHELQKDKLTSYRSHYDHMMGLVDKYYANSDITPILFVNETANFEDVGAPGPLVNWLSIFEETKVYASLPYWGLANTMNELAADTNKPNGAWWVYKWYADMNGYTLPMEKENIGNPSSYGCLYGLGSADESDQMVQVLFGGQAGAQTISVDNIKSLSYFKDADKAHVKIYSTKYTGHHGFADDIPVEFEGDVAFKDGKLQFSISDAELMDAYYAIITPAVEEETTLVSNYEKNWTQTYEAENAELLGNAGAFTKTGGSDLARSNRAEVGGMNQEGDGVNFQVSVPKDGTYRLNVYYSSQAPQVDPLTLEYVGSGGQNRAIGSVMQQTLTVDGTKVEDLNYESTVKWGYYNYKTVYLDLKAGDHTIQLTHKGENQNGKNVKSMLCALLDKIDLIYMENPNEITMEIEPEEIVGRNDGFALVADADTSGAGYAEGTGEMEFYVNAPEDGYYSMKILAKGQGTLNIDKSSVAYAKDAKAESDISVGWKNMGGIGLSNADAFGEYTGPVVYLTAGINQFKLTSDGTAGLDKITFQKDNEATNNSTVTIEAENCTLEGTGVKDDYNYLLGSVKKPEVKENAYASDGKVVEGFRGGQDGEITFQVNASSAGTYKLSMFYSNNEPAPVMKKQDGSNYVHPYNTDLVERYAQIQVNDGTPQTVYFRNTLCWDVFKNVIMDVELQEGLNTITITNDNSYKFSSVQDDFTPRFDKFVMASAVQGNTVTVVDTEEKQEADKTNLQMAIKMAEKLETQQKENKCFTEETWSAVEKALDKARKLSEQEDATQKEVDAAFVELISACNLLENGVQKVGLKAAIKGAEAILADTDTLKQYEEKCVENLKEVLAEAKTVYDNADAMQVQVNTATTKLLTAVTQLLIKAEDARLDILIDLAESLLESEDQYVPSSVEKLKEALESAKQTRADSDATKEELTKAYNELAEAITSLVRKGDKSELKNALDKASEILNDKDKYLDASIEGLGAVKEEAQKVYDNPEASTDEVSEMLKKLIDEILKARLLGDVDFNGTIDSQDASLVLKYAAEYQEFTEEQQDVGDVNRDGASDSKDASEILQYAAEKIESF